MQRNAALDHALDGVGIVAVLDGEGQRPQLVQDGFGIGRRQEQFPLFRAAQGGTAFLLGQAQGAQNLQHTIFCRAKAHPFRVEGEALAVLNGRAAFDSVQQLMDGLDHIQPFFADQQHQLQAAGLIRVVPIRRMNDGLHNQAEGHAQCAFLGERTLHGGHQLGRSGRSPTADHLIHRAGVLTGHHRRNDMAACAVLLANQAGTAMAGRVRRDHHLITAFLHHLAAQNLGALLRNLDPSGTE